MSPLLGREIKTRSSAYTLKNRIHREEEQLQGEYEQFQTLALQYVDGIVTDTLTGSSHKDLRDNLPPRSKRNICNTYGKFFL
jgi:hypothetical protein